MGGDALRMGNGGESLDQIGLNTAKPITTATVTTKKDTISACLDKLRLATWVFTFITLTEIAGGCEN